MALTEGNYSGDWLLEEFSPEHCREQKTIKSGENLVSGQVVAKDGGSDDDNWVAFEDDTDTPAAGILLNAVDARSGAAKGVVIVRGPATVSKSGLTWHTDNDSTDITNGLADLLALGIVAREGV